MDNELAHNTTLSLQVCSAKAVHVLVEVFSSSAPRPQSSFADRVLIIWNRLNWSETAWIFSASPSGVTSTPSASLQCVSTEGYQTGCFYPIRSYHLMYCPGAGVSWPLALVVPLAFSPLWTLCCTGQDMSIRVIVILMFARPVFSSRTNYSRYGVTVNQGKQKRSSNLWIDCYITASWPRN